jgi:hypothetical protein
VREDGRLVDGKEWKERLYNREERSFWERQGIIAFCTCQWNEWMNEWKVVMNIPVLSRVRLCRLMQTQHFLGCLFLAFPWRWVRWAIQKRCHVCSDAQRFTTYTPSSEGTWKVTLSCSSAQCYHVEEINHFLVHVSFTLYISQNRFSNFGPRNMAQA